VLLVACLGAFPAFLDASLVSVVLPDLRRDFPASSLASLSWVLTSSALVVASFVVAAGRCADLLGRRRVFVSGVVVFTLASALCAVAGTVGQLIAFRVVQGVGAAMLVPASLALVVEAFTPDRRAQAVGLWGASAVLASGLGAPVGGALVAVQSWRLAFLASVPLGVVAVVVARRELVESRAPGPRHPPDLVGALLLAVWLGLLTTALVRGPTWGWADARTLVALGVGTGALAGFVTRSRRAGGPVLRGRPAAGTALCVVAGSAFSASLLTHVLYLHDVWDYSLLRTGLALTPGALVAATVAVGLSRTTHGHRLLLVPGALLWAAGLLWYLQRVGPTPDYAGEWLPGQLLEGVGVGAAAATAATAAARLSRTSAYAVVTGARQLGAVLGVALLVALIGTPDPVGVRDALREGWVLAACCMLVVAAGCLLVGPTTSVEPERDDERPRPPPPTPAGDVEQPALPDTDPLPDSLADLPMLAALSPHALSALERAAVQVGLPAGDDLFRQGEPTDALYVVRSGRLRVVQDGRAVNELGRGAVIGELGLLTGAPRSATVTAIRDSALVRLSREQFDAIADVGVMGALACGLARRLQEVTPAPLIARSSAAVVIAVVGLDRGAPVREVSAALQAHLRHWLRVIDPGPVDAAALERAERAADRVVLTASTEDATWRSRALRSADRVVLVTSGPVLPEDDLPARALGADLVLTGAPATREQRRVWHERLAPVSTHVVSGSDVRGGTRALAARLAGRSLGLVLGGGGARGFAHLGVLEELEAAGIAVDRVAGTSMGAVIGGWVAMGLDAASIDAQVYEGFVRGRPLGDYTLPVRSLIRGRRTDAELLAGAGERLIEELPKEFRCVSVDLLNRRRVVHSSGLLAHAIGCSLRLPGLFPPYAHNGALHVDGGVLDNLPVTALDRGEGPLVAVSITVDTPGGPSHVPSLGETLMRTMTMGSGAAAERAVELADLVLRPDGSGVGLLEWHQIDRMRESGRAAARAALPQVQRLLDPRLTC
jgi:predicted acylesterase/phospholipase RssA/MFS family permease/CRP-like cAMP-binding protein